jgi:hypothetical protein
MGMYGLFNSIMNNSQKMEVEEKEKANEIACLSSIQLRVGQTWNAIVLFVRGIFLSLRNILC